MQLRRTGSLIIALLLSLSVLGFLPLSPAAHAAAPVIHAQNGAFGTCATTCSFTLTVTAGDWIVAGVNWYSSTTSVVSVTGTKGEVFASAVLQQQDFSGIGVAAQTFYTTTPTTSSGSDTITLTMSTSQYAAIYATSLTPSPAIYYIGSATGSGTMQAAGPTVIQTSSISWSGNAFLWSTLGLSTQCAGSTATPAAGYSSIWNCGSSEGPYEYSNPTGGVSSPTSFGWTITAGANSVCGTGNWACWLDQGVVFSDTPNVSVTVIGACNFFQLQCWWYPMLFMLSYAGIILLVSSAVGVSPKGKAHLFMSALTYGSLVAVILGIMNIVFPLLMLVLNTLIVLRLK